MNLIFIAVLAASLAIPSWQQIQVRTSDKFLAGSGGVMGGRETGEWIDDNTPDGATIMTIGPSMANVIQFYGHRHAYGLSVSTNPLHRNPSYDPIRNPDAQLRSGDIQYVVWDSYSGSRSSYYSDKVTAYAKKYHGRIVHMETISVSDEHGNVVDKPVIIVWEVHP